MTTDATVVCNAVPGCGRPYVPGRLGATLAMCPRCVQSARRHGGVPQPPAWPYQQRPTRSRETVTVRVPSEMLDTLGKTVMPGKVSRWIEEAMRQRMEREGMLP